MQVNRQHTRDETGRTGKHRLRIALFATAAATIAAVGIAVFVPWQFPDKAPRREHFTVTGPFPANEIAVDEQLSFVSGVRFSASEFGGRGHIAVRFTFNDAPGTHSPMDVQLAGFDEHGNQIVDQHQRCCDGRGITAEEARIDGFSVTAYRVVGYSQPEFYFPLDAMPRLARVVVAFEPIRE